MSTLHSTQRSALSSRLVNFPKQEQEAVILLCDIHFVYWSVLFACCMLWDEGRRGWMDFLSNVMHVRVCSRVCVCVGFTWRSHDFRIFSPVVTAASACIYLLYVGKARMVNLWPFLYPTFSLSLFPLSLRLVFLVYCTCIMYTVCTMCIVYCV